MKTFYFTPPPLGSPRADLNRGPTPYHGVALPAELRGQRWRGKLNYSGISFRVAPCPAYTELVEVLCGVPTRLHRRSLYCNLKLISCKVFFNKKEGESRRLQKTKSREVDRGKSARGPPFSLRTPNAGTYCPPLRLDSTARNFHLEE